MPAFLVSPNSNTKPGLTSTAEKPHESLLSLHFYVSARRMTTYCNVEINLPSREGMGVSDGFVHNPGYPSYYTGPGECKWTIKAPPHQTIKIDIVDLSLTGKQPKNN